MLFAYQIFIKFHNHLHFKVIIFLTISQSWQRLYHLVFKNTLIMRIFQNYSVSKRHGLTICGWFKLKGVASKGILYYVIYITCYSFDVLFLKHYKYIKLSNIILTFQSLSLKKSYSSPKKIFQKYLISLDPA